MQHELVNGQEPQTEMPMVEPMMEKAYEPSYNEALRAYEIRMRFLHRGCIVSVGCKDIAFEKVEDALSAIQTYVAKPYEQQEAWRKILG